MSADYDLTRNAQEDRKRSAKHSRAGEVSAGAYDETKTKDRETLPLGSTDGNADDMFASEDENNNVSAPIAPKKLSGPDAEPAKALPDRVDHDSNLRDNWDDPDGYYRITIGERLDGRYKVIANLGRGIFSGVVRAQDDSADKVVAIKIIRNNETMRKAAVKEIEILEKLGKADPENKKHVVKLEGTFTYRGHLCMVFENLFMNLRDVLKKFGHEVGINMSAVRTYARQMFQALNHLRKCKIIHADLKPDNVLINESRTTLKVCDLGSAAFSSEAFEITPYLVSRFYRAPEVILGMEYNYSIDMWSIGCTLFELYTGKILFTGRNNNQMLRSIQESLGKVPVKMLKKAELANEHFEEASQVLFRSREKDRATGKEIVKLINYTSPVKSLKERILAAAERNEVNDEEKKSLEQFAEFLSGCLALNPEKRLTPADALAHPFMAKGTGVDPAIGGKYRWGALSQ